MLVRKLHPGVRGQKQEFKKKNQVDNNLTIANANLLLPLPSPTFFTNKGKENRGGELNLATIAQPEQCAQAASSEAASQILLLSPAPHVGRGRAPRSHLVLYTHLLDQSHAILFSFYARQFLYFYVIEQHFFTNSDERLYNSHGTNANMIKLLACVLTFQLPMRNVYVSVPKEPLSVTFT